MRETHWNLSCRHNGNLSVARIGPDDVEPQRAQRLGRAMDRKCPKLWACKEDGARTILIFEDADFVLTNYVLVGECLIDLMQDRNNLPDEIYLVETSLDTWTVRRMKNDETHMWEDDWEEFSANELVNITGRA